MDSQTARAIVTRGKHNEGGWKIEDVGLRSLSADELLVRMIASGICHTDVVFGDNAESIGGWPRVMGHEGSGYVVSIGANVKGLQIGDPVLLSYKACRDCRLCTSGHPAHCVLAKDVNFDGLPTFREPSAGPDDNPAIIGSFFGQSSFASLSVVHESSVVNVKGVIQDEDELKLFAPLGCGIQTGSGTILNVAGAKPEDTVAIIGVGGVGLAGLMGAKIAGCRTIIAIDRVDSRLQLAKELGATHTINSIDLTLDELVQKVRDVTDGYGTSITMDTSGVPAVIEKGLEFTQIRGSYIQIGSAPLDAKLEIPIFQFMVSGKRFIGAVEGDVIPQEYIPKMIQWYKEGRFPIDRLVKYYKADDFTKGIEEMKAGTTIKPIILW